MSLPLCWDWGLPVEHPAILGCECGAFWNRRWKKESPPHDPPALAHHGHAFASVAEKCQVLAPMGQQADGHGPVPHPDRSSARPMNARPDTTPGAARSPVKAPGANLGEGR